MSLSDLLAIGRSALLAHQRALAITAQNVANARTPGYSRQVLNLRSSAVSAGPGQWIAQGVDDLGVSRVRDQFLDAMYRRRISYYAGAQVLQDQLQGLEAAVNEPTELGIANALDDFFNAFSDLANEPSGIAGRQLVVAMAGRLVGQFHQLSATLEDLAADAARQLEARVSDANELMRQIAELNERLLSAGGPAAETPDLQDHRDLLIDQLSELLPVQVRAHEDGTVDVVSEGRMLVQGNRAESLVMTQGEDGAYGLAFASDGVEVNPEAGSLRALASLLNETLPDFRSRLDRSARAIVTEVNAIHREGITQTGRTGVDFFDPNGVTASSIGLSEDVAGSLGEIATGTTADPGDNAIALRIAELRRRPIDSLGGMTLRETYLDFAGAVASTARRAADDVQVQEILVTQADSARLAVSGVSVDEEMVNLISQQQAYAAAARLVQVSTELMDVILRF